VLPHLRRTAVSLAIVLTSLLAGCGGDDVCSDSDCLGPSETTRSPQLPSTDPTVEGRVGMRDGQAFLDFASDMYYLGLALPGDDAVVVGLDPGAQLEEHDPVRVWIDGGCAESSPVQCDIVAVEVVADP
jgi:hypothetical protein